MGRARLEHPDPEAKNPKMPPELPDEGCPGGWYRSRFVWSLTDYMRTRTEAGDRVGNPFFDTCDDPLVWAWILYFERQQEEMAGYRAQAIRKDQENRN